MKRTETLNVQYELKGDHKGQDAVIYFSNGRFLSCKYHVSNLEYTLGDWKWMGVLAERISQLSEDEEARYEKVRCRESKTA